MTENIVMCADMQVDSHSTSDQTNKWRVATKYRGKIFEGVIHPDIFYKLIRSEFPEAQLSDCEEGFIAPYGTFLNRKDAKILAEALDLIGPIRPGERTDELWTEQLPLCVLTQPK